MEARIARLETTTGHIKSDVQSLRQEMKDFRAEVRAEIKELSARVDATFEQIQKSFESLKLGRVWDRVWMLLTAGVLLGVMARGFKWI